MAQEEELEEAVVALLQEAQVKPVVQAEDPEEEVVVTLQAEVARGVVMMTMMMMTMIMRTIAVAVKMRASARSREPQVERHPERIQPPRRG